MKYLRIKNVTAEGSFIQPLNELDVLIDEIKDSEIGNKWELELIEMEEDEYIKIPEFEGY